MSRSAFGLLQPRVLAARGGWRRADGGGRGRTMAAVGLGAAFWVGIFVGFSKVLAYFRGIEELGPVLAERLLSMLLLMFFSLLLFSNIITALSSFFLSAEIPFLRSAPVSPQRFHRARLLETLWDSSWMIVTFGLPVFCAYAQVYDAGWGFALATLALLPPFLLLPAALGVTTTLLVVRLLPARRTKDIFALLSVLAVALLYLLIRFLNPERLVRPDEFADFLDFLAALQAPASPWLPSSWAANWLHPLYSPKGGDFDVFPFVLLVASAAAATVVSEMVFESVYATAWSRAQEGRRARVSRLPFWDRLARRLPFISPVTRAMVLKDGKTFFRDTTQWSQLILLGALVVVYVYNFQVMPKAGAFLADLYLTQILAFLNLALAGFVVASIAVRFIYPAISLEGKAFWVVKTAPIRLRSLWWSKFWSSLGPLLVLGLTLVWLGNRALQVNTATMVLSLSTLVLSTFAIAALGLCVGAHYPRFEYENVAKISSGFGGALYMVLAVGVIGLNVALEAWPLILVLLSQIQERPLEIGELLTIGVCLGLVVALDLGVFAIATYLGIRRLESL